MLSRRPSPPLFPSTPYPAATPGPLDFQKQFSGVPHAPGQGLRPRARFPRFPSLRFVQAGDAPPIPRPSALRAPRRSIPRRRGPSVAASNRKGTHMTGNFEHRNRTSQSAASSWAEASANLVKAEDIITPEELAAKLKVPDSWVYEKTRGRCRNPIPCLRLGRYVRFNWVAVAAWLTAPAPQDTRPARPALPNRRKAAAPVPSRPT